MRSSASERCALHARVLKVLVLSEKRNSCYSIGRQRGFRTRRTLNTTHEDESGHRNLGRASHCHATVAAWPQHTELV